MKKVILWVLGIIALLILSLFILIQIKSEPLPVSSVNGDILANKMLTAVNKPAFDSVKFLSWNFGNRHQYVWDKVENKAIVKMKDLTVYLDLNTIKGKAYKNDQLLKDKDLDKAISKAWSNWCNDSFWAFGQFKIFDKGTSRSEIPMPDGKKALLVTYSSGGVTPGDSYLWLLDDNYIPTAFKLWVNIIPLKGQLATWENWIKGNSQAMYSQEHKISFITTKVSDIREGIDWRDFGYDSVSF
jgi:hypothetical protein